MAPKILRADFNSIARSSPRASAVNLGGVRALAHSARASVSGITSASGTVVQHQHGPDASESPQDRQPQPDARTRRASRPTPPQPPTAPASDHGRLAMASMLHHVGQLVADLTSTQLRCRRHATSEPVGNFGTHILMYIRCFPDPRRCTRTRTPYRVPSCDSAWQF